MNRPFTSMQRMILMRFWREVVPRSHVLLLDLKPTGNMKQHAV
jgi:hypothetical protein